MGAYMREGLIHGNTVHKSSKLPFLQAKTSPITGVRIFVLSSGPYKDCKSIRQSPNPTMIVSAISVPLSPNQESVF